MSADAHPDPRSAGGDQGRRPLDGPGRALRTMVLADLGADVVKVEPPEGDSTRGWGPPWVGEGPTRTAAYYLAVNRNKRSLRLDLKTTRGRRRPAPARSSAVTSSSRTCASGSLDRLGFDDGDAARPQSASSSTWRSAATAPRGPAAGRPGYDFVIQAVGGLMSITGEPDGDGGRPTKVGVAISDVVTGLFAAIGILAALIGRGRRPGRPAGRRVAPRIDARGPRQPGPERVRDGPRTGPARQRASEHRPVRDVRDGRRRDGGGASGRSGSGRASARRSGCRSSPPIRASPRTATASSTAPSCARCSPSGLASRARRPTGRRRSRRPRSRTGPVADVLAAFGSPEAGGARHGRRGRASVARASIRQAGIPLDVRRDAGLDPDGAAAPRRAHRRDPRRARVQPARRSPSCGTAGVGLSIVIRPWTVLVVRTLGPVWRVSVRSSGPTDTEPVVVLDVAARRQETLMSYPVQSRPSRSCRSSSSTCRWSIRTGGPPSPIDGTPSEGAASKADTPRHRRVGYFFAKALAPLRLDRARAEPTPRPERHRPDRADPARDRVGGA